MPLASGKTEGHAVSNSSELVIAFLGPSGAGKSTFINALFGGMPRAGVSHGFDSGTTALQHFTFPESELRCLYPNLSKHTLVLLDTPGFQNAYDEDVIMLNQLADWLAASNKEGRTLIGIIYLFPIFPVKMTLHERQNLELLPQLFGGTTLSISRVFPVTSRWDMCTPAIGERREDELCQKFWSSLLPDGASPHRFANNTASARHVVKSIISQYLMAKDPASYSKPLAIQQEQVEGQKRHHFIARLLTRQQRTYEAKRRNLILIMGETGSGKSTFLNDIAGEELAGVNHSLTGTTTIEHYDVLSEDGSSVTTFVDCPGYNHSELSDSQISLLIRDFLAKSPL
ncbi:hypothetical protein BKA70DRAFT_3098 [Coprinopsis sp. MPI-PUGE-AT-0042]|nr:hypothetical protein BKA70DRAFT_3098 [Coprinopsis sp. MPI-PUGE-AT-0042]